MRRSESPVSRAAPFVFLMAAFAVPAAAQSNFEPMAACNPDLHAKYGKVKAFLDRGAPQDPASEESQKKLKALHAAINALELGTDDLFWPLKDGAPLPPACKFDAAKIKGIYAGLAELRGKIGERAAASLAEDKREAAEGLTKLETGTDELMGGLQDELKDFEPKLAALEGKASGLQAGEEFKERAELLSSHLADIRKRVAAAKAATGGGDSSASTTDSPPTLKQQYAQRVADARQRAKGAMNGSFGADKQAESIGAPGGAVTGKAGSTGVSTPGTNPGVGGKAKGISHGGDLIDKTGVAGEGGEPAEHGDSAVVQAVKNSATTPLGGVVNPSSEDEVNRALARKEAAKQSELRLQKMSRMDRAEAEMDLASDRGFQVQSTHLVNGSGELVLERTKGPVHERLKFSVQDGKLVKVPGVLTPEEEGVIEATLEGRGK